LPRPSLFPYTTLFRSGWKVTYVRNWTDVDDKIIRRAAERGEDPKTLAEGYIAACREDFEAISVLPADIEPRATDHVPEMQKLIRSEEHTSELQSLTNL